MSHLITCIGHDKDSWDAVTRIINSQVFDIIYIVTDVFGKNSFLLNNPKAVTIAYILVDDNDPIDKLNDDIYNSLKKGFGNDKLIDLEIALNISSGVGRLHAALISAVMKLGYGIRIIEIDKDGDVVAL